MSERRYIDADALYEMARTNPNYKDFCRSQADLTSLRELLDEYPAADVEPVVRGEWEEHPIADTTDEGEQCVAMFWQCSNCHGKLIYWNFQRTKYCPDCGAHMERIGSGE